MVLIPINDCYHLGTRKQNLGQKNLETISPEINNCQQSTL